MDEIGSEKSGLNPSLKKRHHPCVNTSLISLTPQPKGTALGGERLTGHEAAKISPTDFLTSCDPAALAMINIGSSSF